MREKSIARASHVAVALSFAFVVGGCSGGEFADCGNVMCLNDINVNRVLDLEVTRCESISGDLTLSDQALLPFIYLPCLTTVGGGLSVRQNDSLIVLDLPKLEDLGYVFIIDNESLAKVDMPSIEMLDTVWIEGNASLTSLNMPSVKQVERGYIDGNAALTGLEMSNLESVVFSLEIWGTSLTNLDGLSSLTTVCTREYYFHPYPCGIYLWGNESLSNVDGLSNLELVKGSLTFTYNDSLTNVDGLSSLELLTSSLSFWYNDSLSNLDGLSNLKRVGAGVSIANNESLTSVDGLSNLESVYEGLSIKNNACLSQEEAEAVAASIDVGGTVTVEDNGANYPCD